MEGKYVPKWFGGDSLIISTNKELRFRVMEVSVFEGKAKKQFFEIRGFSSYRGVTVL